MRCEPRTSCSPSGRPGPARPTWRWPRPAVEACEKLGFLPGSLEEKVNPYLRPLYDALHDMVEFDRARALIEEGVVEVAPLAFMRGRTLNDSFVILDEAQNATTEQMK